MAHHVANCENSVIPPTLLSLRYLKRALNSRDWTHARVDLVIVTQVILHLSVILATVPCIKPCLKAFESGGLRSSSGDLRRISKFTATMPKSVSFLPLTQPRPTLECRNESFGFWNIDPVASAPGKAGHRKRVEEWPVRMVADPLATLTTVEHDPQGAKEAKRRRSRDSVCSKGIVRTQSFSIKYEDIEDAMAPISHEPPVSKTLTRTNTGLLEFEDVGGLLGGDWKGKEETPITPNII